MKLHLGCGKRFLPGFYHIDIEPFPHVDLVTSIDKLSSIESGTAEIIYSSHAFEYFSRGESHEVLAEWLRVLRPGGQLMLVVPNFRMLVEIYLETSDLSSILGPLFGEWANESAGRIFHKMTWDNALLCSYLVEAGFENTHEFDPVEFLHKIDPSYDDYSLAFFPHMNRSGRQISLCIQASKPILNSCC